MVLSRLLLPAIGVHHPAMVKQPTRHPLGAAEREAIADLIRAYGERRVVELLEVSANTLGRLAGGLNVTRGTAALVRYRLAAIKERAA